jgi:hypothetical protein
VQQAPGALVQALGKIAVSGQALELLLTALLSKTLRIGGHEAAVMAGRLGAAATIDVLAALTSEPVVRDWLPQARKGLEARNHALHTPWFQSPDTHVTGVVLRNPLRTEPRSHRHLQPTVQLLRDVLENGEPLVAGMPFFGKRG